MTIGKRFKARLRLIMAVSLAKEYLVAEPEKIRFLTVDDYLKFEGRATVRHEYVRGQLFAMSGATEAHNVICGNLYVALHNFLRGTGCCVFQNDMKVRVEVADSFYYPDIMVTCEPRDAKSVFKTSPSLIVEVLSPSTKLTDRREKLVAYRQLSSLRQYVLVHQNQVLIETYNRVSEVEWELSTLHHGDDLRLDAIPSKSLIIPVVAAYTDLTLPPFVKESEEEYELA
jgi:Uma2 family endonuclease